MEHQFIPIILFICIAVVIWRIIEHFTKTKNEQQATVQKLIDSGQALSPELITSIAKPNQSHGNKDFARGLIAISIAIAIFIYGKYGLNQESEFMWLSAFPLMLGIAFLIIHKFRPTE